MQTMPGPGVPIIDAHIHQWSPSTTPRTVSIALKLFGWSPWLLRNLVPRLFPSSAIAFVGKTDYLLADYLPADWRRDHGDLEVRGFVHIQADWQGKHPLAAVDETHWLEQIGGDDLLAIVGQARLQSPQLGEVLDAHAAASTRFVGIRDYLASDPDPGVMNYDEHTDRFMSEAWQRGYAELGRRGLTFDAWMFGPQLRAFDSVLRDHPETRVVLDHLGSPIAYGGPHASHGQDAAARERIVARWREDIEILAQREQLYAKLSGLFMPVVGWGVHERSEPPSVTEVVDRIGPMVEHALAHFGPQRCIFASNFPMDKVSLPWTTLYAAFAQLVQTRSEVERRALFHDNAVRFYGLDSPR